ncbi:MAG TPA: hypothetical protein VHS96_03840 [Bacteroidia bacterium]|nr:hypothetical protein [Bacteroidia bacterium]
MYDDKADIPPLENRIVFSLAQVPQPILVLDKNGMTYKGHRIEDAGEAHRAFIEAMRTIRGETKPSP